MAKEELDLVVHLGDYIYEYAGSDKRVRKHVGPEIMTLDDYRGLAATEPLAAASLTVFLVSLMGIPPTIGFYAKYYIIVSAIEIGPVGLALSLAIVVLSAVSAFYYLRVVAVMYFDEPERPMRPAKTGLLNVGIGAMAIATLLGGIVLSGEMIELASRWYSALTVMAFAGG